MLTRSPISTVAILVTVLTPAAFAQARVEVGPLLALYAPVSGFQPAPYYTTRLPNSPGDLSGLAWGGEGRFWLTQRAGLQLQIASASSMVGGQYPWRPCSQQACTRSHSQCASALQCRDRRAQRSALDWWRARRRASRRRRLRSIRRPRAASHRSGAGIRYTDRPSPERDSRPNNIPVLYRCQRQCGYESRAWRAGRPTRARRSRVELAPIARVA